MNDCTELRRDVIDTCLWLLEKGLVFGTWGNVSVRLDDGNLLMTPSRLAYEAMTPEDLVILSPEGKQVAGTRLSTSERELHRRIMNRRQDIGAIIHMHSPYAMAACAMDGGVPVISEEMCQLLGGAIPLSARFVPSHLHEELGAVAAESVTETNALLLRNHGPVCFGRTLAEARICCQVVEKSCQMYLMLSAAGRMNVLAPEYVRAGRDYYLNAYGKT